MPDSEFYFWINAGIAAMILFGVLWFLAKRDSVNYIDWVTEIQGNKK